MRILVTGASGFVGRSLAERLVDDEHHVRALVRSRSRLTAQVSEVVTGDIATGEGLERALDGIDVAYYLIHSMEESVGPAFPEIEMRCAEHFAKAARKASVKRTVYLGGLVPENQTLSPHLKSRLAVEEVLLDCSPQSIAFRASIIIAARSRSFRLLVRLIENAPVIGLPPWRENRTQPIDGRDVINYLVKAAQHRNGRKRHFNIVGPQTLTYSEVINRIADLMLVNRPQITIPFGLTPVAAAVTSALTSEDTALVRALMESLSSDLLDTELDAQTTFDVKLHSFNSAVERALRDWESDEPLKAR